MSKLLSNIVFSFFLLFQTISFANEDVQKENAETNITAENSQEEEKVEPQEEQEEQVEPQDALSEAEKEALAAEEAELREAGFSEEPVVE